MHTTMKKKYIIPEVQIVTIEVEHLIAESLGINGSREIDNANDVLIKRDRSSRGSYNVWNEDWSN